MKAKSRDINIFMVGVITAVIFIIQYVFSFIGGHISGLFDYSVIDSDDLFMRISVHHIVQMLCAVMLIIILNRSCKIKGFKLQPEFDAKGLKYTVIFCSVIAVYYLTIYIIGSITDTINVYDYELNKINITGHLAFQLLISGPSEEILFRALPIAVYIHFLRSDSKKNRVIAVVLSALLFAAAHINFRELTVSWFQVCYAFALGLAYGFVLVRSKSVVYPMIMHSVSNVVSVGGCYLYMLYFM